MSSWGSNPWNNFCDPHWELICCNKWHPGTSEISKPPEGTHFHAQYGTKTTLVFLPAIGEASWLLLPCGTSGGTVQQESTYSYSCILKVTGQVWKSTSTLNHSSRQQFIIYSLKIIHLTLIYIRKWFRKWFLCIKRLL